MNRWKFSTTLSVMSPWQPTTQDIEQELSMTHITSTSGVVVWTITSSCVGFSNVGALSTGGFGKSPCTAFSIPQLVSRRRKTDVRVDIAGSGSADEVCPTPYT